MGAARGPVVEWPILACFCVLGGCMRMMGPDTVPRTLSGERVVGRAVSYYAYEHFLLGRMAFEQGDPALAAEEFDLALTSDSESTYLLAWHARALDLAGAGDVAGRRIAEALELDPEAEFAWVVKAEIEERRGRLGAAERSLLSAVRSAPLLEDPVLDLGAFLERHGRGAAAEEVYRSAVGRRPQSARIWQALGRAALVAGRTQVALDALRRTADLGRLDRRGLVALAAAERKAGRPGRAVEILGTLASVDPDDLEARSARIDAAIDAGLGTTAHGLVLALRVHEDDRPSAMRAQRLLASGHPADAAQEARAAVAVDPRDAAAGLALGRALREAGDRAGALEAFETLRVRDATAVDATLATASMLLDARENDVARSVLALLVARENAADNGDPRPRRMLAELAQRQGDERTAERVLREGGAATATDLAGFLLDADRARDAVSALRQSSRGSTDPRLWGDLALCERIAGDLPAARRSLDRARALGAEVPEVLRALAALSDAGAEARFDAADRARPGDPRLLALWAESAQARGDHDRSRALTERALRLQPSPRLRAKLERRLRQLAER